MSHRLMEIDLTAFGCPLYYIKAREVMRKAENRVTFRVNVGMPTEDVVRSLTQDGYDCTVVTVNTSYNQIKVRK